MIKLIGCDPYWRITLFFLGVAFSLSSTIHEARGQEISIDETKNDMRKLEGEANKKALEDPPQIEGPAKGEITQTESGVKKECLEECGLGYACVEGECKTPCNPPCRANEVCTGNGRCIPPGGEQSECVPKCREGYECIGGECRSPCNPPCRVTELCTGKGHCLPSQPGQGEDFGVTPIGRQQQFHSERHRRFNMLKYEEFRKKKTNGIILLGAGISAIVTGIVMLAARRSKYGDSEEGKSAKVIGWGAQGLGGFLCIGSIAIISNSKEGMKQAEAGLFVPESVSPDLVAPDSSGNSKKRSQIRGFLFGFRF